MNKVFLMGNLTRDPECRHTNSNNAVANFGVAVNRRWTNASGEKLEEVTFVDCEAWGKTAENVSRFFSKGKPILVEGRLRLDQWEKDGQKFSKLKVVVDNFEFVGAKEERSSTPRTQTRPAPAPEGDDIEVPF